MQTSPGSVLLVACFLTAAISARAAEMRTWTSADGRTVEAEFVRLDGDTVEIKTERGLFRLALSKLSPEDQEFVQQQSPATKRKKPIRNEDREWTLREGTVKARFVRLRDANVHLSRGNRQIVHSILFLTPEDAAFICDLLESRGDLAKLKDDPTVNAVVSLAKSHRQAEDRKREREERALAAAESPPTVTPVPESDPPAAPAPPAIETPLEPAASTTPNPAPTAPVEAVPSEVAPPMPAVAAAMPPTGVAMPAGPMTAVVPPVDASGFNSKDPWERDLAVMQASNQAAYYWLGGILGLLVIFGPIIWVLQRART